jgi:hypothetical protein
MTFDRTLIPALVAAAALLACAAAAVRPEPSRAAVESESSADKEAHAAAFQYARQRCDAYSGDAQASCVIIARARYGRI